MSKLKSRQVDKRCMVRRLRKMVGHAANALRARIEARGKDAAPNASEDGGYFGDFASWAEARRESTGYDSPAILERVRAAALKVVHGEAVCERDSVTFDHVEYSWPLLAGLLRAAPAGRDNLTVLDFGGSLGSSYHQCRGLLDRVARLRWCIVEQQHFAECGRREFATDELCFYNSVSCCLESESVDVVLFSSVLTYVERPYELLELVAAAGIRDVIIDRTLFLRDGARDRITVQRVAPSIYEATYPARLFSKVEFLSRIQRHYRVLARFEKPGWSNVPCVCGGMLLERTP